MKTKKLRIQKICIDVEDEEDKDFRKITRERFSVKTMSKQRIP